MSSDQRKRTIQSMLKRGDLKALAEKLDMSYSYLSQAFSPASKFNFTEELARKVEHAMDWQDGVLDTNNTSDKKPRKGALHALALKGRTAELADFLIDKRVEINQPLSAGNLMKMADIVAFNKDGSVYLIGEQSQDYENNHAAEQLIMLMAITGAEYGVVFAVDSGVVETNSDYRFSLKDKRSRWFQLKQGKVVEIPTGPQGMFENVGI